MPVALVEAAEVVEIADEQAGRPLAPQHPLVLSGERGLERDAAESPREGIEDLSLPVELDRRALARERPRREGDRPESRCRRDRDECGRV